MDGTVHSAAAEQRRVRRVDHRVYLLFGDVAELEHDPHAVIVPLPPAGRRSPGIPGVTVVKTVAWRCRGFKVTAVLPIGRLYYGYIDDREPVG